MYMTPPPPTSDMGTKGPRSTSGPRPALVTSLIRNPVLLERSLGFILWSALVLVLVAKPF